MELRHLRYFVVVAEEQNVTRAALRLHISQPPLSRQIRQLEEELGVDLFEHGPKSMRLTEAGRLFQLEAQAVLHRVEEAVATVRAAATGNQGELHIGYAPSLTMELLPRVLRHFQESAPGIRLRLHDLSTSEMLCGLHEEKLDVALLVHPGKKALAGAGLEFHETHRFRACVAVPPTHPFAFAQLVTMALLSKEPLVAYSKQDYPEYHEWLATLFRKAKKHAPIVEEHDSSSSLIATVEAGKGVALVQEGFQHLSGPRLVVKPIAALHAPLIIGIARRKGCRDRATGQFWEKVLQLCGK